MSDLIKPKPADQPQRYSPEQPINPGRQDVVRDGFDSEQAPIQAHAPIPETIAMKELQLWVKAYQEAQGQVGRNRVLNPSMGGRWKKISDAIELAAKHPENTDYLKQNPLEDLVRENYYIARSESNILNPSWLSRQLFNLTGQGYHGIEADRQAHTAVLRESIEGAIDQLKEIVPSEQPGSLTASTKQSYIESYQKLLAGLPESTIKKVTGKHRKQYWKSLTTRHSTRAPKNWFSESTANALRVVARTAILTGQYLPPPIRPEQPGITAKVNAEMNRRRMATERGLPETKPIDIPVQSEPVYPQGTYTFPYDSEFFRLSTYEGPLKDGKPHGRGFVKSGEAQFTCNFKDGILVPGPVSELSLKQMRTWIFEDKKNIVMGVPFPSGKGSFIHEDGVSSDVIFQPISPLGISWKVGLEEALKSLMMAAFVTGFNRHGYGPLYALGTVVDYLEGYRQDNPEFQHPWEELTMALIHDMSPVNVKVGQELAEGRSVLFRPQIETHAIGFRIRPDGDNYLFDIYNSGDGLENHESAHTKTGNIWYQTRLTYRIAKAQWTRELMVDLRTKKFKNADDFYRYVSSIPEIQKVKQPVGEEVWQPEQKGPNCAFEWTMAYLRNEVSRDHYLRFRVSLLDRILSESKIQQSSDEPRTVILRTRDKQEVSLSTPEARTLLMAAAEEEKKELESELGTDVMSPFLRPHAVTAIRGGLELFLTFLLGRYLRRD